MWCGNSLFASLQKGDRGQSRGHATGRHPCGTRPRKSHDSIQEIAGQCRSPFPGFFQGRCVSLIISIFVFDL